MRYAFWVSSCFFSWSPSSNFTVEVNFRLRNDGLTTNQYDSGLLKSYENVFKKLIEKD